MLPVHSPLLPATGRRAGMVISNYLKKFTRQIYCLLVKFLDLLKRNHIFNFPLYFLFVDK